ncbi:Hsp70 family protein, partial [Burkholderia cenocepacia]|uniref:Hsp70 family protein n=1 Tax=Burkholderia cenocepacia TaxID=95486 RepID=UPI00406D0BBD
MSVEFQAPMSGPRKGEARRRVGLEDRRIKNRQARAALAIDVGPAEKRHHRLAVHELGASTVDVSIIQVAAVEGAMQYEVLWRNGDTFLGGQDLGERVLDY